MADPTPEQRKLSSKQVFVYDATTFALTLEKAEDHKDYIEDPESLLKIAPKLGNRVELYEGIAMIARVNMGQVGWQANIKRALGKCNQIIII